MGDISSNIRFVSQQWNATHDRLEMHIAGVNGAKYQVSLYGDLTGVTASGAELKRSANQTAAGD